MPSRWSSPAMIESISGEASCVLASASARSDHSWREGASAMRSDGRLLAASRRSPAASSTNARAASNTAASGIVWPWPRSVSQRTRTPAPSHHGPNSSSTNGVEGSWSPLTMATLSRSRTGARRHGSCGGCGAWPTQMTPPKYSGSASAVMQAIWPPPEKPARYVRSGSMGRRSRRSSSTSSTARTR